MAMELRAEPRPNPESVTAEIIRTPKVLEVHSSQSAESKIPEQELNKTNALLAEQVAGKPLEPLFQKGPFAPWVMLVFAGAAALIGFGVWRFSGR
jgi:hypothetical protein